MPRQFGKVDASVSWPACVRCSHKHLPGSACPPLGVWLVLTLCRGQRCDPKTERYCSWHRDRNVPQPGDAHHQLPDVPEQAIVAARYEHEEAER